MYVAPFPKLRRSKIGAYQKWKTHRTEVNTRAACSSMISNRNFIKRIEESVGYKGKFLTAMCHQRLHYQATTNNKTKSLVFVLFMLSLVFKEYYSYMA